VDALTTPRQARRPNVEGSTLERIRASFRTSLVVRVMSAMGLQIIVSTSTCSAESERRLKMAEEKGIIVSSVSSTSAGMKMLPSGTKVEVDSLAASRTPFAAMMKLVCLGFFSS
jgi:hypothetical protein